MMEVQLKKLKKEHLEMVREWRNSPAVSAYMYTDHEITKSEHEKWFNKMKYDQSRLYWIITVDGKSVGLVNIYDIDYYNKRCGIAHYIALSEFRGKGIGAIIEQNLYSFIFEILNLNKLTFEVLEFNIAAIKLHEKCGSKLEGRLFDHIFKNNRFYDVLLFTMTQNDWQKIKDSINFQKIQIEYERKQ